MCSYACQKLRVKTTCTSGAASASDRIIRLATSVPLLAVAQTEMTDR